ncbi:phage tail assembly chaperone G [Staphylococcus shinii]|uniref:phage tail assembly chaperone G n=1 Tax=Staphylococcus shinii TaxID=2912228 RepID=UPI003F5613C1
MTKKVEIRLINPETNKVEVHTRESELTVQDKLDFAQMQDNFTKELREETMTQVKAIKIRTEFLASLFDINEEQIIKGIKSAELDDVCKDIFSKISPEEFPDDDDEESGK